MSFGSILRQRRKELDLTQDVVAAHAGISKPYLSNIETGKAKNPPTDGVLALLETALKFEPGELRRIAHFTRAHRDVREDYEVLEREVERLRILVKQMIDGGAKVSKKDAAGIDLKGLTKGAMRVLSAGRPVPVINKVAAGYPNHFTDLDYPASIADEYVRAPDLHDSQAFAAHVSGDSMEPTYREGDIVIFSPAKPVENGADCFVRFDDGDTTFKRFYQDDKNTIRLQPLNPKYPSKTYPREQVTGLWPAVMKIQKL